MRFIRKNGRIIPINDAPRAPRPAKLAQPKTDKERTKNLAGGAVLATTGLGVASAAGWAGGNQAKAAAGAEHKARQALKVLRFTRAVPGIPGGGQTVKNARRIFRENVRLRNTLWRSSLNVRHAGFLAGSALVGLGTEKALREVPGFDEHPTARAAVAGGATVATHFAIRHAFERYMGARGLKAVRSAASFTLRGFARKFLK